MGLLIVILSFLIFFLSAISVFIDKSLQVTRQVLDKGKNLLYNTENDNLGGDKSERK